jgi:hypothetical protein
MPESLAGGFGVNDELHGIVYEEFALGFLASKKPKTNPRVKGLKEEGQYLTHDLLLRPGDHNLKTKPLLTQHAKPPE